MLLLVLLFALLLDRATAPVPPEAGETISCERYGLEGVRVEPLEPEDSSGRGIFDLDAFGPGEEPRNRFALGFEHGGVAGRYHVVAEGLDWSEPVGVIYHFHGDGAFEYESPQYSVSCMAEIARQHNMLLVVPRTPDRTGVPTWWESRDRNAAWFRGLVEERILTEYDVDPSRTWLTGYSGGAQLISQELLADHVDLVPGGGAIMMGGGEAPDGASSEPTPAQLAGLRLRWDVGLEDDGSDPKAPFDALSAARAGHAWYEERGYDHARIRYREGVDHFQLPYAGILDQVLTRAEQDRESGSEDGTRAEDEVLG